MQNVPVKTLERILEPLFLPDSPTPEPVSDPFSDLPAACSPSPPLRLPSPKTPSTEWQVARTRDDEHTPSPPEAISRTATPVLGGSTYWNTLQECMEPYRPDWSNLDCSVGREGLDARCETALVLLDQDWEIYTPEKAPPLVIDLCNDSDDSDEEDRPQKKPRLIASAADHGESRDSTPLRAISSRLMTPETPTSGRPGERCGTCGCTCGIPGSSKGGAGSHKLSPQVMGNILAHLLGSPTGSRKTWSLQQLMSWQYGRSISWPDIARMVGADAGDHDNVRACAKGLQERLPRMKREGKF